MITLFFIDVMNHVSPILSTKKPHMDVYIFSLVEAASYGQALRREVRYSQLLKRGNAKNEQCWLERFVDFSNDSGVLMAIICLFLLSNWFSTLLKVEMCCLALNIAVLLVRYACFTNCNLAYRIPRIATFSNFYSSSKRTSQSFLTTTLVIAEASGMSCTAFPGFFFIEGGSWLELFASWNMQCREC